MSIPLPDLLREHRRQTFIQQLQSGPSRFGLSVWVFFAKRPGLYHAVTRLAVACLSRLGRKRGSFKRLPLASQWTAGRDLPAPQGNSTFMQLYKANGHGRKS